MNGYADLEIGLYHRHAGSYTVDLRFSPSGSEADVRSVREDVPLIQFDIERLTQLNLDTAAYGRALSDSLFADSNFKTVFAQARSTAQSQSTPLRVRLFIGPGAPELQSLRWETLRDPHTDLPLTTSEHVLFSRYLSSLDWRSVHLRSKASLRALAFIANPNDLDRYAPEGRSLVPLDVERELAQVEDSLHSISIEKLVSGGSATLNNLITCLYKGFDILYIVCHGALIKSDSGEIEPCLWLENETGSTKTVTGSDLIARLSGLLQLPRLVVLASCQSAGRGNETHSDDAGALASLGPRLAEIGIPAVLAMQGDITMKTMAQFMPTFFQELQQDGHIDRAVAVARDAVRDRPDWWAPVLFMRLKSGRIWYAPGFAKEQWGEGEWKGLCVKIRGQKCTPILGPGLISSFLGSRREIAQAWAETYRFPMRFYYREDLPQVAQYLAVNHGTAFPRDELMDYLRRKMLERYQSDLPKTLHNASLNELITEIGRQRRESDPAEPHRVLAKLPMPIYITTNYSDLLTDALRDAGKHPEIMLCHWRDGMTQHSASDATDPEYYPSVERPLVYHLFGHFNEPNSLVLTEDDYFEYLKSVFENKDLIPAVIRSKLTDTALLFLGYRLEGWNFRVLFHSIMSQEGLLRREHYTHVAAQIDPEVNHVSEPNSVRRYLEKYFQKAEINIYWGSPEDFVRELQNYWKSSAVS